MTAWRRTIVLLWVVGIALTVLVVARARYVTDLSAFLPAHPTPTQRLLVDQLRDGPASRLILIALEDGDADTAAALSAAMAARLRADPQFASVNNGELTTAERDRRVLFDHRYVLSETVTPQRFTAAGLETAIDQTLDSLASPAGLMLKSLVPQDPTGEMLQIIDQLSRTQGPASRNGVWMSADTQRALLIAQTQASGSDTDAQARALEAIRASFSLAGAAATAPATATAATSAGAPVRLPHLRMSGPGVFAVAARARIEGAAIRLSLLSSGLIVTLLLLVYRSLTALVLGLLPVATGALVGIAAVALGFGVVHGITLGFGVTLIGESVDYSIYFFIQSRKGGSAVQAWKHRFWPTVRLGMLTSVCGFASLLPSGFPGLAQLGLYSISGLIAAAMVTRFVLPVLVPGNFSIRDVAPLGSRAAQALRPLRRFGPAGVRGGLTALAAGALLVLYAHHANLWNRELSALSPIAAADLDYDAKLRGDLGAADARDLVVVSGPDLEAVLRDAERVGAALASLVAKGQLGGFDTPAAYLPSRATQTARRDSLPDAALLRANLQRATVNSALRTAVLTPFLDDVAAARKAPLLTVEDLRGTSLRAGFDALILQQRDRWNALLPLHALPSNSGPADIDLGQVAAALGAAHLERVQVLNLKAETDALYADYLGDAMRLSLAGCAALVLLLGWVLRSVGRVTRVLAPLVVAVLIVAALLALGGIQLTILHLVGMLLIVAVGSNYALFFDRQAVAAEDASLTLASLVIANISTVIGFGLLAFSRVPVLEALGTTVAPGALLALVFAALLAPPAIWPQADTPDA